METLKLVGLPRVLLSASRSPSFLVSENGIDMATKSFGGDSYVENMMRLIEGQLNADSNDEDTETE